MKYCSACGKPMDDDALFCGACGVAADAEAVAVAETVPAVPEVPAEAPKRRNVKSLVFSIIGLVCGISALVFAAISMILCWMPMFGTFYSMVAILEAVPGVIFSCLAKADVDCRRAKTGKILSIISLALGGVFFIVSIVVMCAFVSNGPVYFGDLFEELFSSLR